MVLVAPNEPQLETKTETETAPAQPTQPVPPPPPQLPELPTTSPPELPATSSTTTSVPPPTSGDAPPPISLTEEPSQAETEEYLLPSPSLFRSKRLRFQDVFNRVKDVFERLRDVFGRVNVRKVLIIGLAALVFLVLAIYTVSRFSGSSVKPVSPPSEQEQVDSGKTPVATPEEKTETGQTTIPVPETSVTEETPVTEEPPVAEIESKPTETASLSEPSEDKNAATESKPDVGVTEDHKEGNGGITVLDMPENLAAIVPPREIDMDSQMALPIKKIVVPGLPIADVVQTLSRLTAVPIKLDLDELRARRISVQMPMEFALEETTGAGILQMILDKLGLVAVTSKGFITLTYPESERRRIFEKNYDVGKIGPLFEEHQLVDWATRLITPKDWEKNGGQAKIRQENGQLVVSHNTLGHDLLERFLLTLYYMRGLTPQTSLTPEQIAPETLGWDSLRRKISFNHYEPMPLKKLLGDLAKHENIRILVDEEALFHAGLSQESKTSIRMDQKTVDQVLNELLITLGLTYRIVEVDVLEVTTFEAAAKHPTVELQRYTTLEKNKTPEELAQTIQLVFAPESWSDPDGGAVMIDSGSGLFLVRQSQPIQRAIRNWLGERQTQETKETVTPDSVEASEE